MCVVRLGVGICLWSPRIRLTMLPTLESIPQLPIPTGTRTVPLRSVTRSVSRENVVCVLYRAEPLVSYPLRKVRGSTVKGIWVVDPNEFVILRRTTLENVNI